MHLTCYEKRSEAPTEAISQPTEPSAPVVSAA
jgi:hypothetical protein